MSADVGRFDTVVLKPHRSSFFFVKVLVVGVFAIFAILGAIQRQSMPQLVVDLLVVAAIVAGIVAYFARASVVVTSDRVGKRGLFAYRWVDRSSLGELLVARDFRAPGRTDAFLFTTLGKRVLRLPGTIWNEERIHQFDQALKLHVPTVVRQGPTSIADLRRERPRALTWSETHPIGSFTVTFFGTLAVLIGILIVGGLLAS